LPSTAKADPTYCLGELGTQHVGVAAAFDRVDQRSAEDRSGISKDPESSEERLSVLLAKIIGPGFKTRMELDRPSTRCHN
jgi:hypothetical protein